MAATKHHLAGRELVSAAFALLRHDRTMVALEFVGSLAAIIAFALVAVPLAIVAEAAVPTTDDISRTPTRTHLCKVYSHGRARDPFTGHWSASLRRFEMCSVGSRGLRRPVRRGGSVRHCSES